MSGDVRISGQFGTVGPANHQLGGITHITQQQNRPIMPEQAGVQQQNSFDPAFVITHSGRVGSTIQQNAAAAFFAKKHQKCGAASSNSLALGRARQNDDNETEKVGKQETFCNFSTILAKCPPPPPPHLIKKINENKDISGVGKVRVILRVANSGVIDDKKGSFFKMDKKKKQVTLLEPDNRDHSESQDQEPKRSLDVSAPKMFAFDGLYTDEDGQNELSSSSLCDILHAVVNGSDGTLFCFGHANLGKSYTMIGSDESSRTVGIIPTAISWLFKCIKEKKDKSTARFSVRVSACEIRGANEELRDLLSVHATESDTDPGMYLRDGRFSGVGIQNLSEIRSPNAERAGYYLDYALSSRSVDSQGRDSHFIYTIHVYQHSVATQSVGQPNANVLLGGRSRLHLIDFGCCERTKTIGGSITQAGLGNVILGILNGQRHLPFKESKVTQLLREVLGSVSCQAALLAHISPEPSHYSETLHTIQLASRIHRMRRKKMKVGGSSGGGSGSGSSDENRRLGKLQKAGFPPPHDSGKSSSDMTTSTDPSSSEQSCDTVIYLGPRDDDGTDAESPPVYLPSLNSGDYRAVMSKVLKGSTAEMPPSKYRSLERKQQRSPKMQNMLSGSRSPISSQQSTPVKTLSSSKSNMLQVSPHNTGSLPRTPKGKMPLFGKVAGYRQPAATSDQPQQNPRLSMTGSGITTRSRLSEPSEREIWVDSKPICDKDLVPTQLPQQYDTNAIYGYMDEHKKQMIQQWVEGQAISLHSAPPSHLTGVESLAWLQAQTEQSRYKVLTQFKMAESSTSSCSDTAEQLFMSSKYGEDYGQDILNNDPYYPTESEMKTRMRETVMQSDDRTAEAGIAGVCVINKSEEHLAKPTFESEIALQSNEVKETSQTCQHKSENKCSEGETRKSLSPGKQAEKPNLNLFLVDSRSVGSKASTDSRSSSKKSDVGTNTDIPGVPFNTKHQDPYGASRRLPLRRTSGPISDTQNDELGNIRTLDELYSHCEQLVETLSQASEELKAQCHNDKVDLFGTKKEEYIRINQSDSNGIDDIEIYEVSEGSEASVEVTDTACQATEEDIALCLGLDPSILSAPQSGSEKHPGRILSQENSGRSCCPLSSKEERQNIDMQLRCLPASEHIPLNKSPVIDMSDFDTICEEVSTNDHEEYFNKKFDQLEKLHELYKSVSSISAKSQSRLELNKNRHIENKNLLGQRSASFSLTGLLGDLDNLSLPSTISDDLNSLCSEPAWVSRQSNFLDINRNSTSCTTSLDILDVYGGSNIEKSSLSLSDLMSSDPPMQKGSSVVSFASDINIDPVPAHERSDSPILEGIDSELAKYAKLKDLEQAYRPKTDAGCDNEMGLGSLRHPDGASNPDLKSIPADSGSAGLSSQSHYNLESKSKFPLNIGSAATLPRRSPGNGRSSSGSDIEETSQKHSNASSPKTKTNIAQKEGRKMTPDDHHPVKCSPVKKDNIVPAKLLSADEDKRKESDKEDFDSNIIIIKDQKEKNPKIPRFSRLFGSVKKISRSPTQISKGNEEKMRSKASKRQTKTSQISLRESSPLKIEKFITDKPSKTKYKFFEKREKCLPKSPIHISKNAKGTLSSEPMSEKSKSPKPHSAQISQKNGREKKSVKTKSQGVCVVNLPSPYSYPSKVKTKKSVNSETSGSGYDSGIDSGIVTGIKSPSLVKIRGKGADTMIMGIPSSTLQLQRRSSRSHCKSSGYESFGLDSESTSVDSYHGTLNVNPSKDATTIPYSLSDNQVSHTLISTVPILHYDEKFVDRLDRHWRFEEIKRLKKKQEHLKGELYSAKSRINSDPRRWSYELHTESSGLDPTDPNFVEAFEKETVILNKRVQACKSHVVLSTCFDNKTSDDSKQYDQRYNKSQGCTADCEPAWECKDSEEIAVNTSKTGHL